MTEPTLKPGQEWCIHCDGCGWCEGGEAIVTVCSDCNGTGIFPTPNLAIHKQPARAGEKRGMKLFICPKESYTPHHCDECHEVCRITVRTTNEEYYCISCVREMLRLLESKE